MIMDVFNWFGKNVNNCTKDNAPIAQWIEQWISNPSVVGSNPTGSANRETYEYYIFNRRKSKSSVGNSC